MGFDYFHPGNVDQFTFYRVPKMLLGIKVPEEGKPLSHGAMLLYGMLLDRMGLSSMNSAKDDGKWVDEDGNVFIYYSQQSIMKDLKVSNKTASKLMKELKTCGLIETRLQGLGRPARLYLKNFASGSEDSTHESCNKFISRNEAKSHLKVKEVHTNNTDESDIERSDTDLIVSADGYDEMMQRTV